MEIIDENLTWEDITLLYPDEWVLLGNPIFDGMKILKGQVLAHHQDKRVASMEGGKRREGFKKVTLSYTGDLKLNYHIGLLRNTNKN
jgi:hypothetical protein